MLVRRDRVNGHGICHGGIVFTRADSVRGFACNFEAPPAVATGATIEFLAPVRVGDELTAIVTRCWQQGRGGVYDVAVTNQNGRTVALLRCRSRRLRDPGAAPDMP
jgi:acyl-CoA thioesterase